MKKTNRLLMMVFLVLLSICTMAQAPKKFNYQAVVRDNSGTVISNQSVSLRISIHEASATGTTVYQETHSATTNQFGLVTLQIGGGTPSNGSDFATVNWSSKAKYIQVEIDPQGGSNYTDIGSSELLSVPYALYADQSGNNESKDTVPSGILGQTLRHDGSKWLANSFLYNNGTNIGINTTTPTALFQVYNGSVAFSGSTGSTPISGAGRRMMWVPDKGALRAGYVTGNNWNADSIGSYSVAFGRDSKAKGAYAFALGYQTTASNSGTSAFGSGTTASGLYSVAAGFNTVAKGAYSFASGSTSNANGNFSVGLGYYTNANGTSSVAMGYRTYAKSYASVAFGRYNVVEGDSLSWVATDPLLALGNGTSATPANAFTVYKNGNTTVSGQLTIKGGTPGVGKVLTSSDATGLATWSDASTVLPTGTEGQTLRHNGTTWEANSTLFNDSLRIGIGTNYPTHKLEIQNPDIVPNDTTGTITSYHNGLFYYGSAITGIETSTGLSTGIPYTIGSLGTYNTGGSDLGVFGHSFGVFGGMGVKGSYGPSILNEISSGYLGLSSCGVYGESAAATNAFGVYGKANGPNYNIGIYGEATGGTTNWAGYFDGRTISTDSLTIGAITIPNVDGVSGQVLKTDGAGKLSWKNDSINNPAGSNGYVQFNNAGAFGADAGLFWDNTNKRLGIGTMTPTNALNVVSSNQVGIQFDGTNASYASLYVNATNVSAVPGFGYEKAGILFAYHGYNSSNNWFLQIGGSNKLTVHTSGITDINNQSRSRDFLPMTQGIPSATWTKINFSSETFDEQNEFNTTTTYLFTATEAGYYQVNSRLEFQTGSLDAGSINIDSYVSISIWKNGQTMVAQGNNLALAGADNTDILKNNNAPVVADVVYLLAGETIEIRAYQTTGGSLTLNPGTTKTYVSIHKSS